MNEIVLIIGSVISFIYLILILLLSIGSIKLKDFNPSKKNQQNSFSVIIPFRNEAPHLKALLNSFKNLDYPVRQFEIILVNDASTDNSESIILDFVTQNQTLQLQLLQLKNATTAPKKEALEKALKIAQFNWIITTDADCVFAQNWLNTFDNFIQSNNCDMMVAPVNFISDNSFLQNFQQTDFMSLMGATQGGFGIKFPFLCNGANLCYKKSVFMAVNGFEGNKNIASGDDIFLMEKFLKHDKNKVKYLKSFDSIVQTSPQKTWKEFVNQRIRWASKTTAYENITGKLVGLIVLSMNFWLFLSFIFLVLKWISPVKILFIWMLKITIDYFLLSRISKFYRTKIAITQYIIFSFIYPFYTVLVGFLSFGKGYKWKDRNFLR